MRAFELVDYQCKIAKQNPPKRRPTPSAFFMRTMARPAATKARPAATNRRCQTTIKQSPFETNSKTQYGLRPLEQDQPNVPAKRLRQSLYSCDSVKRLSSIVSALPNHHRTRLKRSQFHTGQSSFPMKVAPYKPQSQQRISFFAGRLKQNIEFKD